MKVVFCVAALLAVSQLTQSANLSDRLRYRRQANELVFPELFDANNDSISSEVFADAEESFNVTASNETETDMPTDVPTDVPIDSTNSTADGGDEFVDWSVDLDNATDFTPSSFTSNSSETSKDIQESIVTPPETTANTDDEFTEWLPIPDDGNNSTAFNSTAFNSTVDIPDFNEFNVTSEFNNTIDDTNSTTTLEPTTIETDAGNAATIASLSAVVCLTGSALLTVPIV